MSYKTTLRKNNIGIRQITDYSNGYSMTIIGNPDSVKYKSKEPMALSCYNDFDISIADPKGKPVCQQNANVPEWLDPVLGDLQENSDGEVFRQVTLPMALWVHEDMKSRAGRCLLIRISDTIFELARNHIRRL